MARINRSGRQRVPVSIFVSIVLGFVLLTFSFQNCSSGVSFQATPELIASTQPSSTTDTDTDPNGGSNTNDTNNGTEPASPNPGAPPDAPPVGTPVATPGATPTPPPPAGLVCQSPRLKVGETCVCPAGSYDTGNTCITCTTGQLFNPMTLKCDQPQPTCVAGQTYDGYRCVPITPSCDTYVELTSTKFAIPPRNQDASGKGKVCYFIRLAEKIGLTSSPMFAKRRTDIVARNHGGSGNASPYEMATKNLRFTLQGVREVVLAGDTFGGKDIYVDNFFLVEILYPGLMTPKLWASGTADARPYLSTGGVGPILVNNQPVNDWHAFGQGGTSQFKAVDLSPSLVLNQEIEFTGSALDCGSVGETSDVYLLFR